MRQTVPVSGLMGRDEGQRLFRELLDGELARHIAHSSNFGIGEALYQQLAGEAASSDHTESLEAAGTNDRRR